MTLCPDCTDRHRTDIEFAAAVIDSYIAGRYRSQAAADLRALLPPKPTPDTYTNTEAYTHNHHHTPEPTP